MTLMPEVRRLRLVDGLRIAFLLIFAASFIVTEIGRKVYRPYIYAHGLFD